MEYEDIICNHGSLKKQNFVLHLFIIFERFSIERFSINTLRLCHFGTKMLFTSKWSRIGRGIDLNALLVVQCGMVGYKIVNFYPSEAG